MRKTLFPYLANAENPLALLQKPNGLELPRQKGQGYCVGGTPDQQRPCSSGHLIYIILHHYLANRYAIFLCSLDVEI